MGKHILNGAVSEKIPQFLGPLPAEYVTEFSGQTDAPNMTCGLDRQTCRQNGQLQYKVQSMHFRDRVHTMIECIYQRVGRLSM